MSLKTLEPTDTTEERNKTLPDLSGYKPPEQLIMALRGRANCSLVEAYKRVDRLLVILAHISVGDEVRVSQEARRTWYLFGTCNPVEYDELCVLRLGKDIPPPKMWMK